MCYFFYFDVMQGNLVHTLVAIVLVAGISFLFTTVAANAIAIVGTNPGIGNDSDDIDSGFGRYGGCRVARALQAWWLHW